MLDILPNQEDDWDLFHQLLGALHVFSAKSEPFARCLVRANIVEPIQLALSSPYYQARQEEEVDYMLQKPS